MGNALIISKILFDDSSYAWYNVDITEEERKKKEKKDEHDT